MHSPGMRWGVVRTSVQTTIHAPPARVMATFLDYARWPDIFLLTIASTELLRRRSPFTREVMVHHRKEGRVLNVLTVRAPEVVARALRRYTLEPMRAAAESQRRDDAA